MAQEATRKDELCMTYTLSSTETKRVVGGVYGDIGRAGDVVAFTTQIAPPFNVRRIRTRWMATYVMASTDATAIDRLDLSSQPRVLMMQTAAGMTPLGLGIPTYSSGQEALTATSAPKSGPYVNEDVMEFNPPIRLQCPVISLWTSMPYQATNAVNNGTSSLPLTPVGLRPDRFPDYPLAGVGQSMYSCVSLTCIFTVYGTKDELMYT